LKGASPFLSEFHAFGAAFLKTFFIFRSFFSRMVTSFLPFSSKEAKLVAALTLKH
jgi:hypothetical protein